MPAVACTAPRSLPPDGKILEISLTTLIPCPNPVVVRQRRPWPFSCAMWACALAPNPFSATSTWTWVWDRRLLSWGRPGWASPPSCGCWPDSCCPAQAVSTSTAGGRSICAKTRTTPWTCAWCFSPRLCWPPSALRTTWGFCSGAAAGSPRRTSAPGSPGCWRKWVCGASKI